MAWRQAASSRSPEHRRNSSTIHIIEGLSRRFAEFHRRHPRRTRVPDELRRDTLAALRQGVTRTQLRRACGVSSKQLAQWQKSHGKIPKNAARATPDARVFSVVGDGPAQRAESLSSEQDQLLELRLDGWSISVRRVGR